MASKTGGGNLLVDKGEKIGLGVAAVVGVALLAFGLMSALNPPQNPADYVKAMETKAGQLTSTMNSSEATIPDVGGVMKEQAITAKIPLEPDNRPFYDPTQPPDSRRITPVILSLVEGQADMAVLKILANDFKLERDPATQEVIKVRVGVVQAKDPGAKIDRGDAADLAKQFAHLRGKIPGKRRDQNPGAGMFGGPPGAGMFGGPGGGMRGSLPGTGDIGGPPGAGMFGGPPGAGMFGGPGAAGAGRNLEVTYIEGENDEDIEKKLNGRKLAITLHPQKMVVLQASFPYRAQLERFRQALRLNKVEDLYNRQDDMPVFNGVDLQRRTFNARGDEIEGWQSIELAANTQDLRAVKLYDDEDPADLKRVELHEDHMLVMPLPHAIAGKYPEMKLETIKKSIEKVKKQDPKLTVGPPPKSKYTGDANPFRRGTAPSAGLYNPGAGGEGGSFLIPPSAKKGMGTEPGAGTGTAGSAYEPPDYVFVRVYDTDIKDGQTYEYRMRVKVKNPNYGKKDLVSKPSDAENEELPPLEEQWFTFPTKVNTPKATYYYVADPTPPSGKTASSLPPIDREKGQAVVQFQQWLENVYPSPQVEEPVGDWVQSELLATRGQYVYGKAFAPVPLWSPTENTFVLRELVGEKVPKGKEPRRGVELYPVRPRTLLAVEVAGGRPTTAAAKVPPNVGQPTNRGGLVDDQSAAEVLFMLPDGTMEVRSSARDRADADRKEREDGFKKWVEETEKQSPTPTPEGRKKNDF
jgi:hypothetical protein